MAILRRSLRVGSDSGDFSALYFRQVGAFLYQRTSATNLFEGAVSPNFDGGRPMKVPCPVPLQSPWSPAGYKVVEVEDVLTVTPAHPQGSRSSGDTPVPAPARRPSSPVGYRVTQVA